MTKVFAWYANTTPGSKIGKQSTINMSAYRFRFGPAFQIIRSTMTKMNAVIQIGMNSELTLLILSGLWSEKKRYINDVEELKDRFAGNSIPAGW